jgi:hypothetical protein
MRYASVPGSTPLDPGTGPSDGLVLLLFCVLSVAVRLMGFLSCRYRLGHPLFNSRMGVSEIINAVFSLLDHQYICTFFSHSQLWHSIY